MKFRRTVLPKPDPRIYKNFIGRQMGIFLSFIFLICSRRITKPFFYFNILEFIADTRQVKKFFAGFHVRSVSVKIKRDIRTEFSCALTAPARIISRRNTAAVDEKVEFDQIIDPALQPIEKEPIEPKAARILARRNTAACDEKNEQPHSNKMLDISSQPVAGTSARSV